MHDAFTIGIPVLVILVANFINRAELKEFRTEMNARFDRMESRFDAIEAELRYFHGVTGRLDGRLSALEKR